MFGTLARSHASRNIALRSVRRFSASAYALAAPARQGVHSDIRARVRAEKEERYGLNGTKKNASEAVPTEGREEQEVKVLSSGRVREKEPAALPDWLEPGTSARHLTWQQVSSTEVKHLPTPLLQVDYLPDDATEDEIAGLFSEFGKVLGVMLRTYRVDRFFGRAFVLMAEEEHARNALAAAGKTELKLRDETLAIDLVHRPPDASPTLWVNGITGSEREVEAAVRRTFSPFGEVRTIDYAEGKEYCHVTFRTVAAAQNAVRAHLEKSLQWQDRPLRLDYSYHIPTRVLHVSNFIGDVMYICSFFREYINFVEWVAVTRGAPNRPGNVGWIRFDSAEHAEAVRDVLVEYGLIARFSNRTEFPAEWTWKVPPSYKNLRDWALSPEASQGEAGRTLKILQSIVLRPVLITHVLHLDGVPKNASQDDIESAVRAVGETGPFTVHKVLAYQDGSFSGRVLVSFDNKDDAVRVREAHEKKPLAIKQSRVQLNPALLPRLNDARPVVMVERIDRDLTNQERKALAEQCKLYSKGKINRFWKGLDGNYYAEFNKLESAILCLEQHSLDPITVKGRKVRLNFAPSRDEPEDYNVYRKIIWNGVVVE